MRQERERRYISEYMMTTWPEGNWQLNVELGPIPQEYVDRMLFAFISGAKPLESFEEYATVLQVMGIDRATEILNRIRSGVDGDRP